MYQQSLYSGKFPDVWKHSVIIPLYKGRGERSSPASYRPISLCSCIGKILEKLVHNQLTCYLTQSNSISKAQHGFVPGRSTVTNLLSCDAAIADILSANHAYDIVTFDFKAAFDKAPHRHVIQALAQNGIKGSILSWYASFLTGRTEQVKVGDSYSAVCEVVSGVIQGSVSGPDLYSLLVDTLLRTISLPRWCFADDIKFLADVTLHSRATVQADIDVVSAWSDEMHMPLSLEKCGIIHGGYHQPNNAYVIHGITLLA